MNAHTPPPFPGPAAPPRSNTNRNLLLGCAALLVVLLLCGGSVLAATVLLTRRATDAMGTAVAGSASTPVSGGVPVGAGSVATTTPQVKPELEVRNVHHYRDNNGGLWFIGEVINTGPIDAVNVQVEVTLRNDAGQVAGTGAGSPGLPALKPGRKVVWQALILSAPQRWKEEQVQAEAQATNAALSDLYHLDLEIDSIALSPPASQFDGVRAKGEVRNTGSSPARAILITVGLYDATGKLIAVAEGTTQRLEIAPGESAPFEVLFLNVKEVPPKAEAYARALR